MKSKLIYGLIGIGILLVFYLSWIPNPRIGEQVYLPNWLGEWTDAQQNDTIRTGVPFLGIGIVLGFYFQHKNTALKTWCLALLLLTSVGLLAELGQLFMPLRSFDLIDILWAFVGACIGLFLGCLFGRIIPLNMER